jgi:hypothetical protein
MNLDLRLPMGLMFTIVGALLTIYGLISDPAVNEKSLGINVNLWWGLVMLVFGLWMLWLGWSARSTARKDDAAGAGHTPPQRH